MLVKSIRLKNFRNYKEALFKDFEKINVFIGKNAQGKTNFIEALFFLIRAKSFKNAKDTELISFNEDFCEVEGIISLKNVENSFKIQISRYDGKKYFLNDKEVILKNYKKAISPVVFKPDDLYIVKNSPQDRRKYIDDILISIDSIYAYNLSSYKKILFERNKILKDYNKNLKLLDIYDIQLAKYGSKILIDRLKFLKNLEEFSKKYYKDLSKDDFKILYLSTIPPKKSLEDTVDMYIKILKTVRNRDLDLKITTIGPHRDDIDFKINDRSVKTYGSQGEIRSVVLSLKLGELKLLTLKNNINPILLLDDVFSELDSERRNYLFNSIRDIQTFITSTSAENLKFNEAKYYLIENGTYKEIKWQIIGIMVLMILRF